MKRPAVFAKLALVGAFSLVALAGAGCTGAPGSAEAPAAPQTYDVTCFSAEREVFKDSQARDIRYYDALTKITKGDGSTVAISSATTCIANPAPKGY